MSLSKLKSVYGIAGALGAVAAAAGGVAWYLLRDKRAKYVGKEAKATVKPEYTKEHVLECSAGARLAPAEDTKRHMLHYDSQWNSSEIAFKIANGHFSKIVVPCGKLDSGRAQLYRDGKPEYREIKGQDGNPLLKPVMVWHPTLVAQYKRLMRRRFQQIIRNTKGGLDAILWVIGGGNGADRMCHEVLNDFFPGAHLLLCETNVLEQFTASNLENLDVVHLFGFTGADEQSFKSRWSTRDNFMTLLLRQLSKLPVQVEYLLPEDVSDELKNNFPPGGCVGNDLVATYNDVRFRKTVWSDVKKGLVIKLVGDDSFERKLALDLAEFKPAITSAVIIDGEVNYRAEAARKVREIRGRQVLSSLIMDNADVL